MRFGVGIPITIGKFAVSKAHLRQAPKRYRVFYKTTMKQTFYILILTLVLLSCNNQTEKAVDNSAMPKTTDDKIKLHKLKKLFVTGDFDGDGKLDTIYQHNFSRMTKTEIEYSADPIQNEWDTVVKWFYDQDANLYLTINKNNQDTLNLGTAQGLYCLINIGDNNADGKDEIALVIDYLDFSRVNSCKIYSLCKDKWTPLRQFGIHEGSFDFTTDKELIFDNIKDFLEKQKANGFTKTTHKTAIKIKEILEKCCH